MVAAVSGATPKPCVYCMGPNFTAGRCCCRAHARHVASMLSSERSARDRAIDRRMNERRRQLVLDGRWRDIAMGRDRAGQLAAIFGVEPEVFAS